MLRTVGGVRRRPQAFAGPGDDGHVGYPFVIPREFVQAQRGRQGESVDADPGRSETAFLPGDLLRGRPDARLPPQHRDLDVREANDQA